MPGFDGTGPWGEGPMTGGARGYCSPAWAGSGLPMYGWRSGYGPNFGRGRGRGFRGDYGRWCGWGRGFRGAGYFPGRGRGYAPVDPPDHLNMLKTEADAMKNDLDEINRRIKELEETSAG